jgi:hypothetical protein
MFIIENTRLKVKMHGWMQEIFEDEDSYTWFLRRLTARSAEADLLLFSRLVAMVNSSSSSVQEL